MESNSRTAGETQNLIQEYMKLWSKANPSLFASNGYKTYSQSPSLFVHTYAHKHEYEKRMLTYACVERFDKFVDFKIYYNQELLDVEGMYYDEGDSVICVTTTEEDYEIEPIKFIPVFSSYLRKAKKAISWKEVSIGGRNSGKTNPCSEIAINGDHIIDANRYTYASPLYNTKKETKMKDIKDDAVSSITLATDLAKGRTALATVHGFITQVLPIKFSWFAKLTGKDKAIVDSPYTKLAGAAVAHAIALQLNKPAISAVTKLAQDAALVEVARLIPIEDVIAKLTNIAPEVK